jgi:hypothetical protein
MKIKRQKKLTKMEITKNYEDDLAMFHKMMSHNNIKEKRKREKY